MIIGFWKINNEKAETYWSGLEIRMIMRILDSLLSGEASSTEGNEKGPISQFYTEKWAFYIGISLKSRPVRTTPHPD